MLFNEIYSSYYNTVAAIISEAVDGKLTDRSIYDIVRQKAFSESIMTIPDAVKSGDWPFILENNGTVIKNKPRMPLSTLEKRWLRAIMNDKRIRLFAQPAESPDEVEPLYDADDFVYFDRYGNGDPFEEESYITNFRTVLSAIKQKRSLRVTFKTQHNESRTWLCNPDKLEYSAKDDKFRLIAWLNDSYFAINMARITQVELFEHYDGQTPPERRTKELELMLTDQRSSLERVMLHFSHFEKETKKLDDTHYHIKLRYMAEDENELLIRVLSFGPALRVLAPFDFVEKIRQRLKKQIKFKK